MSDLERTGKEKQYPLMPTGCLLALLVSAALWAVLIILLREALS